MSSALMPPPSAQASIQCLVTASQPGASQAQRREAVALADQVSAAIKSVTAQHGRSDGLEGGTAATRISHIAPLLTSQARPHLPDSSALHMLPSVAHL